MEAKGKMAMAIAFAAVILLSGSCLLPPSSAETEEKGEYGNVWGMDYIRFNELIKLQSERTIEEWLIYYSDSVEGYEFGLAVEPRFDSNFATIRKTTVSDDTIIIKDRVSGFMKLYAKLYMVGNFPEAGHYESKGEETMLDLIVRTLEEAPKSDVHEIDIDFKIDAYVDAYLTTKVDRDTGEVSDIDLQFRSCFIETENRNFDLYLDDLEDGRKSMDLGYKRIKADNDFYLNFDIGFDAEGLKMISDEPSWHIEPKVTEHVSKSLVSTHLKGGLWDRALSKLYAKDNVELPKFVLDLLAQGGNYVDLYDTIKLLTGSDVPDLTFTTSLDAHYMEDEHGYKYTVLESADGKNVMKFSMGAYILNLSHIVSLFPDSVLPQTEKSIIMVIFAILGLNSIDVKDISKNLVDEDRCMMIMTYADSNIREFENDSAHIPTFYLVSAVIGIIISILILIIWRRSP
ncbi:MAG: hypothetical protein E7Z64_05625 [Thermoplasmata archaeon]|nr:hypothetical protein [Thermoplasmata archaeon]